MHALTRSRAVVIGLVVGVPLSVLFLWLALRGVDLDAVGDVLVSADVGFVALAVASIAAVYIGQAVRWRAIARTPGVPVLRFTEMVVSGVAVNNVLPGRIGDLLRVRWLHVDARIPGGRALASVFIDRIFDVLALVAFLVLSLPFVARAEWLVKIAVGGLALLVLLGLVLVVARVYTREHASQRRTHRGRIRRAIRDTIDGIADPIGRRRSAGFIVLSVATWAMWALAAWLVARSLGIELSAVESLFVTAVVNLGVAIPSSPGFIGTYQWLAVSVLALLDVGSSEALAFAILMHAVWYVPTLLVGGAFLLRRAVHATRGVAATGEPVVGAHDA